MQIRVVAFDLDGPILDSFREGLRRIRIVATILGVSFTREHHRKLIALWGLPGVELIMQGMGLGEKFVKETFYPAWERYDLAQQVPLVPRTREVLAWLRRNQIVATLLTSRHRDGVIEMLDKLDLASYFKVVSTKFDTPYRKPDPRVFQYTLQELYDKHIIKQDKVVFVGDTPADVDAGVAAKIETVLVQTGPYLLKHAEKLPLPLGNILNSIDDLPGWIEEHHEPGTDEPPHFTEY